MPAAALFTDALWQGPGRGRVWEEDTVKTIEILDDMGHRLELGQIPEEDVERACGVIDSLAITGEAVTPVLTAQLRALLARSGIRLQGG